MSGRAVAMLVVAVQIGFVLGVLYEDVAKEAEAALRIQRVVVCDPVRQGDCLRVQNGRLR